ncbi:MAG: hypothetical protein US89_C0013G0018 [Candidatus Peregrinibacteria bacterium GW2011_GWF2_38_29]|nr:MAG: hypothetical protein US89_C0013G0018 [Candidatus Peregrinibacteria bacterium GW2011_GWF2_38_29]HBB02399.1 hypothetical protein [Candidatus Peregrinibacteria bacterium]
MGSRKFLQKRNLLEESKSKIKDYDAIIGRTRKDYELLRKIGIPCKAFIDGNQIQTIQVTKQCWNHIFKHPIKRQSRIEKLERALCLNMAIKLLERTTTYQEVSRERDKGGNQHLFFGIIGYIRGNRIKVVIRKQEKNTDAKFILFSFYQTSQAPIRKDEEKKLL